MKLKPPKTWQLIVIIVSAIVLAIGGSFLGVYLKTGFKPVNTPPEEIVVDDVDGFFNSTTSQYEVVNGFRLKVTTPTEEVNQNEITLSFPSGIYTTKTDDGKISDGIIIVPEKVNIDDIINVELVKEAYIGENGERMINKGGISKLLFTTQNTELSSSQIQIAVDVPAVDIKVEALSATTGDRLTENETGKIAQGTHFVLQTAFYPEASRYMFSDDKNSAVATKREKNVYFESASSNEGISFNYNNGDIYFVAGNETSAGNIINAYSFASAAEQAAFEASNANLAGLPLYTEAIRVLSTSDTAAKTQMLIDVVEANVGSFSISPTEGSPFEFTVNKKFVLSAGQSEYSDEHITIRINDTLGYDLSAMIKNVGIRIVSIKDVNAGATIVDNLSSYVTIKGGATKTFDGKDYILINSNVKNLNHANWEISTNGEYEITAEVKLFVQDENGATYAFDDETERKVYMKSQEHVESDIYWETGMTEEGISMTIVYDKNGDVLPSQYATDLRTVAHVPEGNVYQKKVFFVYYDAAFPEGKGMSDYVSVATDGAGMYTIFSGENKHLYPLINGYELIAKEAIDFNLVFATVRTDAYGNPIMNASGTYIIEKISTKVLINVKKTLQGFSAVEVCDIDDKYFVADDGRNYFAIPTGVESAFNLKLTLKENGDSAIFDAEKSKLKFYSSTERNGTEDAGVFVFGDMQLDPASGVVTVPVSVKSDVNINAAEGIKYFVRVEYDNSVEVFDWTAQSEGEDNQQGIMIYNQRPASIENSKLTIQDENENIIGLKFSVAQTMGTNGQSSVVIHNADAAWNEGEQLEGGLAGLNKLINEPGNTIVKDHYGREFEYNYIISSSNSQLVIPNNNEHELSFGSGEGEVDVTISAGEQKFTFYLKVSTSGVTAIKVDNIESESLSNPTYALAGKKGTTVTLKNTSTTAGENGLLDVYVTDGTYDPSAYVITLKTKPDGIDEMIAFTETNGEITSFTLSENFGEDVTLSFSATNEAATLNFTFQITIQKYAFEETVAFGTVKYGEDTTSTPGETIDQIGVADADKGENFDSSATYVYAAFPIDLNEYLKVRLGEEGYINWNEVFGETAQNLTTANGDVIGTLKDGKLTFKDVYEPTAYTFILYANPNSSRYAYYKEVALTVCPNFKLVKANRELTVLNLQVDDEFAHYFSVVRTTLGSCLGISALEDITGYEFSQYLGYQSTGKIKINSSLEVDYSQSYKPIIVSLKANPNGAGERVVATCQANYALGVGINDITNYSSIFNQSNVVKYNGKDVIWITGNGTLNDQNNTIQVDGQKMLYVSLVLYPGYYQISGNLIRFISQNSSDSIVAGDEVCFKLKFSAVSTVGETTTKGDDFASLNIPYVWSKVGNKVASYEYESENASDVTHTINNPNTQQYRASVVGGQDYYLIAPFEYIINELNNATGSDQLIIINKSETATHTITFNSVDSTATHDGKTLTLDANYDLKIEGDDTVTYSVGQPLKIGGTWYYYNSYTIDGSTIAITIYEAYVGEDGKIGYKWNGSGFEAAADTPYTVAYGIYGKMLTSLGDVNFLTGLSTSDFGTNIGNISFGQVTNQKFYTIDGNKLKINDIVGAASETFAAYFEITQSANGTAAATTNPRTYSFYLSIAPNATAANNVTYPFGGNIEMLNIATGTTTTINMTKTALGADTQNAGKYRIADQIEALSGKTIRNADISSDATLKIKELSIDGTAISTNASLETAGDGIFVATVISDTEGAKVALENKGANTKNVKVVVKREYPNVYGADVEYSFSINSNNIRYIISATSPSAASTLREDDSSEYTWTLANTSETAQTINITTKQLNESGASSNVDKNKVETTQTTDLDVEDYTIEYTYNAVNPQLSIKLPNFVGSEKVGHVYFQVNGTKIATITIKIPATITASKTRDSQAGEGYDLIAGKSYVVGDIVSLASPSTESSAAFGEIVDGEGGSETRRNHIQIVNENGVETTHDYISVNSAGNKITILNANSEQSIRLKFNYTYAGNTGFAIFEYKIQPNVAFKTKLGTQNVVAGTDYTTLKFTDLQNNTTINATGFELATKTMDTNLFESITMSGGDITVKTKYVAQTTAASVVVTISYSNNDKELFSQEIEIPFVIYPAVQLNVNYPNPDETAEPLTYESVVSGTGYAKFLTNTAEFASVARFQAKTGALNGSTVEYGEADVFTYDVSKVSVKEYNNMTTVKVGDIEILTTTTTSGKNTVTTKAATNVAIGSTFTFTRGTGTGSSYVILQITYKGVTIEYTVYVFDTVVQGKPNATINTTNEVETIYADRVATAGLFNKNRLLEIEVTSSATVGAICYPYVVNLNESGEFASIEQQLLQFKIESGYVGRTIYVDSSLEGGVALSENKKVWLLAEPYTSGKTPVAMSGVIFKRTAGRVEYTYALADSTDGIRINYNNMQIGETSSTDETTRITTHTVGYKFSEGGIYSATISYKTKTGLDFAVEKSYDATNSNSTPEFIEIEAHYAEHYSLIEQAGLYHPSTGERITSQSMGNANISYEVINFGGSESTTDGVVNYPTRYSLNSRGYMSTNEKGDDYLKLHDRAVSLGDNNQTKKIYDYYLLGLGCAADGDYVLLKITYSLGNTAEDPFYVAIKIVPDYKVTLGGAEYAPEDGKVSNAETPYEFTPDDDEVTGNRTPMLIAEIGNTSNQLVSVVRENWNQINISYSFNYTINASSTSDINATDVIDKLNLTDSGWTEYTLETGPTYYKPNSTTIKIVPKAVVFGTKKYLIEMVDNYGYVINFYFNLKGDKTPDVYDLTSSLTFTEGEDFDIGLLYDAIAVDEITTEASAGTGGTSAPTKTYSAEIEYNKSPESESVKKIILQNIEAWGLTTPLPNDAALKETDEKLTVRGLGDHADEPKFQDVTVTGVTFKHQSDNGMSMGSGLSDEAKQIKIGTGDSAKQYDIGTNIGIGQTETDKTTYKTSKLGDGTIQLTSTINGEITSKTENGVTTYGWNIKIYSTQISGSADEGNNKIIFISNDKASIELGEGDTFIEILDPDKSGKVLSKFIIKELDVKNNKFIVEGIYNSFVKDDKNYWLLGINNWETDKKEFKLVNKQDGCTLATDALFWPSANDKYRTLTSGYYKVPIMDGWIYGTSETATVTIYITLQYTDGDNTESCVVDYNATIVKKARFGTSKKVITDGVEFDLADYISVKPDGANEATNTDKEFYDDTLEITVPSGGQAVISVNVKDNEVGVWTNKIITINNNSTYGQKTEYLSISEIYGKTISPEIEDSEGNAIGGNTVKVSWYGSEGAYLRYANKKVPMSTGTIEVGTGENADNFQYNTLEIMSGSETATYKLVSFGGLATDNYAGSKIKVGDQEATVGFADGKLKLTIGGTDNEAELPAFNDLAISRIKNDTLYIENARKIPDNFQYNITKSYIIKANGKYYQYKHNYTMTPRYSYFDDGLGIDIVKGIDKWKKNDENSSYTISLNGWASAGTIRDNKSYSNVTVAPAANSSSNQPECSETTQNLFEADLTPLYFDIGIDTDENIYSEATIDQKGNVTTGSNFVIDNQHPRYILINIYVKASGGPDGKFDINGFENTNSKKLLGQVRIYLV